MMPLSIRCFHNQQVEIIPATQFFILSKGHNAGKPGLQPWTNSFVATASNDEMKDFYFWLTYGLYKAKCFKVFHRGSVIPFINLNETQNVIMPAARNIYPNWQDFKTILQQLQLLEKRKDNLAEILKATATLQEYLVRDYLMKNGIKV